MFWTYNPDHTFNEDSLHAGKPVKQGEKIVLTKWIRENKFAPRVRMRDTQMTIPL